MPAAVVCSVTFAPTATDVETGDAVMTGESVISLIRMACGMIEFAAPPAAVVCRTTLDPAGWKVHLTTRPAARHPSPTATDALDPDPVTPVLWDVESTVAF